MANENKNSSGQAQPKSNPGSGQSGEPTPQKSPTNPFGEQESQGNEQLRRAPGSDQEYQGNQPEEKRAPGVEEDDSIDEGDRKSA